MYLRDLATRGGQGPASFLARHPANRLVPGVVQRRDLHRHGPVWPGQEDQARNRKAHSAANLALLRKTALNLARLEPGKASMRGKLKRAGRDNDSLLAMLAQFANPLVR